MAGYVDQTANANVSIETFHARVHEGTAFHWGKRFTGITSGQTVDIIIEVNTGALHFNGSVIGAGLADIDFVTVGSYTGGTSLGAVNRNTFKEHASNADVIYSASINVVDAIILETIVGGAADGDEGAGGIPGRTGDFNEFVLRPGTYGIRFTNVSGATARYSANFEWYEPSNAG